MSHSRFRCGLQVILFASLLLCKLSMQVNAWDITSKKCIWTHIFSPFFYTDTELVKLSISLSYLWIGCPIVQDLCILGFGENLMWHFPCILKGLFFFVFASFHLNLQMKHYYLAFRIQKEKSFSCLNIKLKTMLMLHLVDVVWLIEYTS